MTQSWMVFTDCLTYPWPTMEATIRTNMNVGVVDFPITTASEPFFLNRTMIYVYQYNNNQTMVCI